MFWGLTLTGLIAAAPMVAQETAPEEEQGQEPVGTYEDVLFVEESLPYVPDSNTIVTKLPQPLQKTPASVGVVSEPLMEEQGSVVLGDALRNISGVNVQTQSGVADFFVVRGFDSISSGLVLVDGANEPEITFYQLYNIERVEVLKGPGGFIYGANPTGGTVNMVRKQPAPGSFFTLGLSGGSFGTYGGSLDWNGGSDDLGVRVNGLWRGSEGYRDGRESEVQAVNPAFTWRPSERSSLNVSAEFVDASFSPDSGLPILTSTSIGPGPSLNVNASVADVDRETSYQSPYDRSEQEIFRLQADYETTLSDAWTLRNKVYYRSLDWLSDGTILNGVFPTPIGPLVARTLTLLDDRQQFLGDQFEVVFRGRTGSVTHQLLGGIEIAQLRDEFTLDIGLLPLIGLENPVETASGPVQILPGFSQAADAESTVVAPYLVDQIGFSEQFQLVVGARFDSIDYEDQVTGTKRDFSEVSPMLGLVYTPIPELSLYANTATAFAPPSSLVVGERAPEESEQVEVGAKADLWGGKLQTTFALFELERTNVGIPDNNGITQQVGNQRSRGAEFEIAAEPLPRLRTFFSYAYTDAELTRFAELVQIGAGPADFIRIDRSGNVPAFAPEHMANLWVSKRFGNGFGLAGGGRYLSEQFIDEDNVFEAEASVTLDAALFYEWSDWRVNLNLKNLTDEEYFTRGFGSNSVIPAEGFALYGGVEYRVAHR
jgi:TonB-dependent siderophore receptor